MPRCRHRNGVKGIFTRGLARRNRILSRHEPVRSVYVFCCSIQRWRHLALKTRRGIHGQSLPRAVRAGRGRFFADWSFPAFCSRCRAGCCRFGAFTSSPDFGTAGNFFLVLGAGRHRRRGARATSGAQHAARTIACGGLFRRRRWQCCCWRSPLRRRRSGISRWRCSSAGMAAGIMNTAVLEGGDALLRIQSGDHHAHGRNIFWRGQRPRRSSAGAIFGDSGATRLLAVTAVVPAMAGISRAFLHIDTCAKSRKSR